VKVFIVEQGEYSDRHVVAVFSTEEKANVFVASFAESRKRAYTQMDVGEWDLDSCSLPASDLTPYEVRLDKNGDVRSVEVSSEAQRVAEGSFVEYPSIFASHCFARDPDHAVKIALDRRAIHLSGVMEGAK
jgi:hypothetical protein